MSYGTQEPLTRVNLVFVDAPSYTSLVKLLAFAVASLLAERGRVAIRGGRARIEHERSPLL